MIRPTRLGVALVAAGLPLALLPNLVGVEFWIGWLAFDVLAVTLFGLDLILTMPALRLRAEATAPALLYLGRADSIVVAVETSGWRRATSVEVVCDLEGDGSVGRGELRLNGGRGRVELELDARRRGTLRTTAVWLRYHGPLGLTERIVRRPQSTETAVVPDIKSVRAAALRMSELKEFVAGIKSRRYIGDGSQFESLREFQAGFDHRAIDWKASARHHKLLVREYQAERNDRIILAFDTGRLMGEPLAGMPRLDHAISAGLLLAYLSLRMGDRVGLFAFDARPRQYVEPQPGVGSVQRLLHASAGLGYQPTETNFTLGMTDLSQRLRRRSVVIVLTDFEDTVTAELMVENLDRLARRHVVLFVSIRDAGLQALLASPPRTLVGVNRRVVAGEFARERELVLRRLRRSGVWCIDAVPAEVSVELINRYLHIKRRGLV